MAFTQADLNAVERMIATGTLKLDYDGKRLEYRSMDELLKARNTILADLNRQTGNSNRHSMAVINTNR